MNDKDTHLNKARAGDECWQRSGTGDAYGIRKKRSLLNRKQKHFSFWYFLLMLVLMVAFNMVAPSGPRVKPIEFSEFKNKVAHGEIRRVEMSPHRYIGYTRTKEEMDREQPFDAAHDDTIRAYKTVPVADQSLIPLLDSMKVEYYARAEEQSPLVSFLSSWLLPALFMVVLWSFVFRKMGKLGTGVMSFGNNQAQLVAEGDVRDRFDDVAGVDEAKEELAEVVDFLKNPRKYTAVGGKIPKGILLVGPPGTGKTLSARAVAGEAGVPFFKMSGADFVEMFVGVGAARVRDLFRQARQKAPCIIFIDELDAIGKARGSVSVGGHDEREQTLNQLLVEMDGFDSRTGVIILGATNRPEILDPALLRPGRFDRQILIDKPDLTGREDILRKHTAGVSLVDELDLHDIAARTPGFAGADLANLVNEAALLAVRRGREKVTQSDFEDAIEKVIGGLEKKNKLINKREREIVAHHETGHALVAAFTPGSDAVKKITIVPRGMGALGYTMQVPVEERFLMSERELVGKIDVLLGGRAAEEIIFGEVSTGAANDLVRATEIARRMITDYGMSEKYRNVVLQSRSGPAFLADPGSVRPREYSEQTQQYIDESVARIIGERYKTVKAALSSRERLLRHMASRLLTKETLNEKEFADLLATANDPIDGREVGDSVVTPRSSRR